eukprot:gene35239-47361_t
MIIVATIGDTGQGKSTFNEALIRRLSDNNASNICNECPHCPGPRSHLMKEPVSFQCNGVELNDSPGLNDIANLKKFVEYYREKKYVNAFLFIVKQQSRASQTMCEALRCYNDSFGENFKNHLFFVFTFSYELLPDEDCNNWIETTIRLTGRKLVNNGFWQIQSKNADPKVLDSIIKRVRGMSPLDTRSAEAKELDRQRKEREMQEAIESKRVAEENERRALEAQRIAEAQLRRENSKINSIIFKYNTTDQELGHDSEMISEVIKSNRTIGSNNIGTKHSKQYGDNTENSVTVQLTESVYPEDLCNLIFRVRMKANGNNKWRFILTIKSGNGIHSTFQKDGAELTSRGSNWTHCDYSWN